MIKKVSVCVTCGVEPTDSVWDECCGCLYKTLDLADLAHDQHDALRQAEESKQRRTAFLIKAAQDPELAFRVARKLKRPWPEGEETIKKNPYYAYMYALHVIKGRWLEAEQTIKKNPEWAWCYARDVIKGRWLEAEQTIKKNPNTSRKYNVYLQDLERYKI